MKVSKIWSVVVNLLLRTVFTLRITGLPSFNNVDADYIVWAPDFWSLKFFHGDNLQKVLAAYHYLKLGGCSASIYTSIDIGRFFDKKIIYFGGHNYNVFSFSNYVGVFEHVVKELKSQGNQLYPELHEVKLWENKGYMHDVFSALNVRTPKTDVCSLDDVDAISDVYSEYPLLVKEVHSCSSLGLYKVSSKLELVECLLQLKALRVNTVVIQALIDIRRDLRVILVGGKIVLHYWRVNLSSEWMPTSTGRGSSVDFDNFPTQWESWIHTEFEKLNIRTGAFDIAWDRDDLSGEPYILEVSPFYQPNPVPPNEKYLNNYGGWKKGVNPFGGYQSAMVSVIFSIQKDYVDLLLAAR